MIVMNKQAEEAARNDGGVVKLDDEMGDENTGDAINGNVNPPLSAPQAAP
jgi:hypothetical protein